MTKEIGQLSLPSKESIWSKHILVYENCEMATAISSSRSESAFVPGVRASALIGSRHLNGFKSSLLPWLVDNNYHRTGRDRQTDTHTDTRTQPFIV